MKHLVALLGIMFFGLLSSCSGVGGYYTIQAIGEGTVTVSADTVTIGAYVESSNENSTLAEAEAQEMLSRTTAALMNAGVDEKEIGSGQNAGVSRLQLSSKVCRTINNNTTCEESATNKLEKSILIRLKTTDQSRIRSVIDAASSAGASAKVIGYGLSDPSSAVADAHKMAVANARKNAADIAQAAGGRLGSVVDVAEYYPPFVRSSDSPGMVDVTSMVLATYRIA
jgi:uncharacterized protein YggE